MRQREWEAVFRGFDEKGLYRFTVPAAGAGWVSDGELFASPTSAALQAAMGIRPITGRPLFPVASAPFPSCQVRSWKSPQWCHSEDFVVVTLMCTDIRDPHLDFGTFTSRVVLVDLREAEPRLHDLTGELERLLGAPAGSYHSIFATCGTPS